MRCVQPVEKLIIKFAVRFVIAGISWKHFFSDRCYQFLNWS